MAAVSVDAQNRLNIMLNPRIWTLKEVASILRISERWLNEWLRRNPADETGEPFYKSDPIPQMERTRKRSNG